jgi:hypothetical protein
MSLTAPFAFAPYAARVLLPLQRMRSGCTRHRFTVAHADARAAPTGARGVAQSSGGDRARRGGRAEGERRDLARVA